MEQVSGPVGVERRRGDGVSKVAGGGEGEADRVGQVADDGLLRGVGAAPVASPAWESRVSEKPLNNNEGPEG